ncbi:hypothetical protein CYMTET_16534, partial [Cymbomonas tetramitiformis]
MIEQEKVKEEAALAALVVSRKVAQHMAFQSNSRMRTSGARPLAVGGQAERWAPRRPTLAALTWKPTQDDDAQVAAVSGQSSYRQARVMPTPNSPTPNYQTRPPVRERPCFACGKLDHLVANCKDEAALAKWRANAPARLARKQAQVAACVAVLNGEVDESSLDERETEVLEEVSTLAALDIEGYAHLRGLCGIEEQ